MRAPNPYPANAWSTPLNTLIAQNVEGLATKLSKAVITALRATLSEPSGLPQQLENQVLAEGPDSQPSQFDLQQITASF